MEDASMPKNHKHREYRFEIDAFSPTSIPMSRLAEYVSDLAKVFGNNNSVHLLKIEGGSTVPVLMVEWEAEPKVRDRIKAIKNHEGPEDAQQAAKDLDRRLLQDNATAVLIDPAGSKVFRFPGRENATKMEFGPVNQAGVFQGIPIKVGGENDPVPVHLEDGKEKHIVLARRSLAKDIAQYLFTSVVRVEGMGRWIRHTDGEWEMLSFHATSFKLIEDADIRKNIGELRKLPGEWKNLDDPLAELEQIRRGAKLQ
jgi:hypothetical protein